LGETLTTSGGQSRCADDRLPLNHNVRVKPLLLLDVDGVLSPLGRTVPRGFERRTTPEYDVVICPAHGEWLRALVPSFEIVWATTWGESANRVYGPIFDLPRFPVVPLGDLPRQGTRKLARVAQYAGSRALAWLDDELYDDATAWADSRQAPTLLRRTSGSVGMQASDRDALEAFLRQPH
jgi:hypothetical protein